MAEGRKVADGRGGYFPRLTVGMCLAIKAVREPEEFNLGRCSELAHETLAIEPMPEFLAREWDRWREV